MYYNFLTDLNVAKKLHEDIVAQEAAGRGIPCIKQQGKSDFDFLLAGKKIECKFDIMSGLTGNATFEDKLFARDWDYLLQMFTYHRVFSRAQVDKLMTLYERKRVQMGDGNCGGTLIPLNKIHEYSYLNQFLNETFKERVN